MTSDGNDPTLNTLRYLAVLEPDPARSERVRQRCRAALSQRALPAERATDSRRFTAIGLESVLMYGLSAGYLAALVHDVVLVYVGR